MNRLLTITLIFFLTLFLFLPQSSKSETVSMEDLIKITRENQDALKSGVIVYDMTRTYLDRETGEYTPKKYHCTYQFKKTEDEILWKYNQKQIPLSSSQDNEKGTIERISLFDGQNYYRAMNYGQKKGDFIQDPKAKNCFTLLEIEIPNIGIPPGFEDTYKFVQNQNDVSWDISYPDKNKIELKLIKQNKMVYQFILDNRYHYKCREIEASKVIRGQEYKDDDLDRGKTGDSFIFKAPLQSKTVYDDYKKFNDIWYPTQIKNERYRLKDYLESEPYFEMELGSENEILIKDCQFNMELDDSVFSPTGENN